MWETQRLIDRRSVLRSGVALAAVVGTGGLVAGCEAAPSDGALGSGKPKSGGTLRAGLTGGGQTDTIDAAHGINFVDLARVNSLYDGVARLDQKAQPTLVLAESLTSNAKATNWTLRLRPDITFHNGRLVTADDVLFTFNRAVSTKSAGAVCLEAVDLKNARVRDSRTLELPCSTPYSSLDLQLATNSYYLGIVPAGYNPRKPVGAGPFKFESFTAGQRSVFSAYEDYWDTTSRPYIDSLEIINFSDETAQLNGLQSGQIDLANQLSATSITLAKASSQVVVSQGDGLTALVMRCDRPPFDDVRVRQALRLLVDRPKMNEIVFGGQGKLGNDMFSFWDADYDHGVPQRTQDIAQAKSLLADAGYAKGLTVELTIADVGPGAVKVGQVYASQAKAAGVDVKLNKVTADEFLGEKFLQWDFSVDTWFGAPYLSMVSLATLKSAYYNETHFENAEYEALYQRALATTDHSQRGECVRQMMKIDFEQGGYIIPMFPPNIDAYGKKVHGASTSRTGASLGDFNFKKMWLDR